VNTTAAEYLPVLTADGSTLIFARVVNGQEDFFSSNFADEKFTEAKPLTDLNTANNEAAHTLSADGKVLIFTACNRQEGMGSCDLYYSQKSITGWTRAKNLGATINSEAWDSQPSLSADGKTLYFSSKREGGLGGSDIFYSTLKEKAWSEPMALPGSINTSGRFLVTSREFGIPY